MSIFFLRPYSETMQTRLAMDLLQSVSESGGLTSNASPSWEMCKTVSRLFPFIHISGSRSSRGEQMKYGIQKENGHRVEFEPQLGSYVSSMHCPLRPNNPHHSPFLQWFQELQFKDPLSRHCYKPVRWPSSPPRRSILKST